MTKLSEVYKCPICGNIVEVLHEGQGILVCCGQPMAKLEEKSKDAGMEKHVPVVEKTKKGIKVSVGSVPHPMEPGHFIEWIEVLSDGRVYRAFLSPGKNPQVEFPVSSFEKVRELCNVHGLWVLNK
jgi:superoxide reductase